ncbi:hypothetical protein AT265_09155 [Bacillus cereus]|nr:hypothetical protein AT265_09155 [Bacillus cereus]PEE29876.1 hypothetical protein CON98_11865 [Bacillus toyonensis]
MIQKAVVSKILFHDIRGAYEIIDCLSDDFSELSELIEAHKAIIDFKKQWFRRFIGFRCLL